MSHRWPRGSEWRKWDLHVHSPASHGFKGTWRDLIVQLGFADCDVIGVNDYFSVAGYAEVKRRLDQPAPDELLDGQYSAALEALRGKTLLPVVELRMNNLAVSKNATGTPRFNFHIVFSPRVSTRSIESLIRSHKTQGQSIGDRYDRPEDLLNLSVSFDDFMDALSSDAVFKDAYLIWLPYDEYGGIDPIDPKGDPAFKANLIRRADILGSGNRRQADYFLWKDTRHTLAELESWFGRPKPCIKGSDSHDAAYPIGRLRDESSQATDRYCWIKANPTFDGLRQIVHEPEDRVFIGDRPPKLVQVGLRTTDYVRRVRIRPVGGARTDWFDTDLPLNPGMVAIIGNKGSGKSALADIIALAGNSHCPPKHLSFLTKDRFRERNDGVSKHFQVELEWFDGQLTRALLSQPADTAGVERIQYIPQSYLESICTENEPDRDSGFQKELRKVIFSHISDADRLGHDTLDALTEARTREREKSLLTLRQQLSELNRSIVKLEQRSSPESVRVLYNALEEKQRQLKAIESAPPTKVAAPDTFTPEQKAEHDELSTKLETARTSLVEVEAEISDSAADQRRLAGEIDLAGRLIERLRSLSDSIARSKVESQADLEKLGLDVDAIIRVDIDTAPIDAKLEALRTAKRDLDAGLDPETDGGLESRKRRLIDQIGQLRERVSAPAKAYEAYREALREWGLRRKQLEGDISTPDTCAYLAAQLKFIQDSLPGLLAERRMQRAEIAREIHNTIASIRDVHTELFAPGQALVTSSVFAHEGFRLEFASTIEQHGFRDAFLDRHVSQGVTGSFYGKEQGARVVDQMLSTYNFDSEGDAVKFAAEVEAHLRENRRAAASPAVEPASQLRQGVDLENVYDYVWGFEYLFPEYSLRLDGKELRQLSPGERGTLLLLFYLLVDKSLVPIVVDQPEENLDNHTVYRLLIPVIKRAKSRRQVIMVTHNPNVAVVCDAEQIVHASIDRADGNRVTYSSGAIEDPTMNRLLLDVLEGTKPAFRNRRDKYHDA